MRNDGPYHTLGGLNTQNLPKNVFFKAKPLSVRLGIIVGMLLITTFGDRIWV